MVYLSSGILFGNKKKQRNAVKAVLRGKFIPIYPYTIKEERSQINDPTFHLKELETKEQTNPKASIRKEIKKITVVGLLWWRSG